MKNRTAELPNCLIANWTHLHCAPVNVQLASVELILLLAIATYIVLSPITV